MAILNRSAKSNLISKSIIAWVSVGIALYVSLLIWNATNLSNVNHYAKEVVNIGPINLMEIEKTPYAGGFKATFQFLLLGSLIYIAIIGLMAYGQMTYSTRKENERSKAKQPKKVSSKPL